MNGLKSIAEVVGAIVLIGGAAAYVLVFMKRQMRLIESDDLKLVRETGTDWEKLAISRMARLTEALAEIETLKKDKAALAAQLESCHGEKMNITTMHLTALGKIERLERRLAHYDENSDR